MRSLIGVCLLLVAFPFTAVAWGPSSHLYVASKIVGTEWPQALFGAMAPDMNALTPNPSVKSVTAHLMHSHQDFLEPSMFALGFATHNGAWGADWYSHCYYSGIETTYLTSRMRIFATEFGVSMNDAEGVLEGVCDFIVRQELGPQLGELIVKAVNSFGPNQVQALVDAYAVPLSQGVAGLTVEEAEAEIRGMCERFVMVTGVYGQQLILFDIPPMRATLIQGFQTYFGIDYATAAAYMQRAEELCSDCTDELDRIAEVIRPDLLDLSPTYSLPIGEWAWLWASLAIVFAGSAALNVRWRRTHRCSHP